jgi:hypothetical protein
MKITWLSAVGFIVLTSTCVSAEIFRCRTPDGNLVMTDQQAELPADCQPVDEPTGKGSFNILPPAAESGLDRSTVLPEQTAPEPSPDPSLWQSQAEALVQSYKDAVRRRYHENLEVDRRLAMDKIGRVKQQKMDMLDDLAESNLKRADKQSIRDILEDIQ